MVGLRRICAVTDNLILSHLLAAMCQEESVYLFCKLRFSDSGGDVRKTIGNGKVIDTAGVTQQLLLFCVLAHTGIIYRGRAKYGDDVLALFQNGNGVAGRPVFVKAHLARM